MRFQYQRASANAYLLGTLFSVLISILWPALMQLVGVFDCVAFNVWTIVVIVLAVGSAVYLILVPPIAEIIQV